MQGSGTEGGRREKGKQLGQPSPQDSSLGAPAQTSAKPYLHTTTFPLFAHVLTTHTAAFAAAAAAATTAAAAAAEAEVASEASRSPDDGEGPPGPRFEPLVHPVVAPRGHEASPVYDWHNKFVEVCVCMRRAGVGVSSPRGHEASPVYDWHNKFVEVCVCGG